MLNNNNQNDFDARSSRVSFTINHTNAGLREGKKNLLQIAQRFTRLRRQFFHRTLAANPTLIETAQSGRTAAPHH